MLVEKWKSLKGIIDDGENYEISNLGKIRNKKFNRELKPYTNYDYLCIGIKKKKYRIHRLVALAFIPNPEGLLEVNHKNLIKSDNSFLNLEWCTRQENIDHANKYETKKSGIIKGESHMNAVLTIEDVKFIKNNFISRNKIYGIAPLARKFGVGETTIASIVKGITWKDIKKED